MPKNDRSASRRRPGGHWLGSAPMEPGTQPGTTRHILTGTRKDGIRRMTYSPGDLFPSRVPPEAARRRDCCGGEIACRQSKPLLCIPYPSRPLILLVTDVLIDGQEHLEVPADQGKQPAVFDPAPPAVGHGGHRVADERLADPRVTALVSQDTHRMNWSFANSRNATACSRDTVGNPSMKSSRV